MCIRDRDWYINQLRRKINDSDAIKMSMPPEAIRGFKRVQVMIDPYRKAENRSMDLRDALKFLADDHPLPTQSGRSLESYFPTKNVFLPINRKRSIEMGLISPNDSTLTDRMNFTINKGGYMLKGDVAVLDIIANNIWDRPIYFAVTCRQSSLLGLQDFTRLEGLALRITPKRSKGESIYGMIGNGSIDTDLFYENFMTKFKWGNFDKMKLFVDRSYGPTVQTTRFGVLRAARNLLAEGDKERTISMLDQYFEAFPAMNFPYDANTTLFIDLYIQAGAVENAKKHLRLLAQETAQRLKFFDSLGSRVQDGYESDRDSYLRASGDMLRMASSDIKDEAFTNELTALLGDYSLKSLQGSD